MLRGAAKDRKAVFKINITIDCSCRFINLKEIVKACDYYNLATISYDEVDVLLIMACG